MSEAETTQMQCGICLDLCVESNAVNMCGDQSHGALCKGCVVSYIGNKIDSAFLGSCPTITCPLLHSDTKRRRILDYKQWRSIVNEKHVKQYSLLSESILAFLCGGCHSLKSLQIVSTDDQVSQAHGLIKKSMEGTDSGAGYETFTEDLRQFSIGELLVDEFYNRICTIHFSGSMVSKVEVDMLDHSIK